MEKLLVAISIVALCVIPAVRTDLQCYVCTNCGTPSDTDSKSCEIETATTTPAPTTSASTTVSSAPTTQATTTSEPSTTDQPTSSSEPSTTDQSSSSSEPSSTDLTTSTSTTIPEQYAVNQVKRKRRFLQDESISNRGCICYSGKCDCSGNYTDFDAVAMRDITYQCYQNKYTDADGVEVLERGCKEISGTQNACELLNATDCSFCSSDNCNSAISIPFSIALLLCALCLSFLY